MIEAMLNLPADDRRRMVAEDPAQILRGLYNGIDGFAGLGAGPSGRALRPSKSLVYGELTATGIRQLVDAVQMTSKDTFVDLGAGVGKVVLMTAMTMPGAHCMGVELDGQRHHSSAVALLLAELLGLIPAGQCELRHANMLQTDLAPATILFANSTCFSADLLYRVACRIVRIPRPVTLATFRALEHHRPRRLRLISTHGIETSWKPSVDMHVYRSDPPIGRGD